MWYICRPGGCGWEGMKVKIVVTRLGAFAVCPKCGCLCTKEG
jgi:hypothetical protein